MPWTEVGSPVAEMTLRTDGTLEWNSAMQVLLLNPRWVKIVWDSVGRHLGLHFVPHEHGFPVYAEPESSEYRVDSGDALAAVGISVTSNYTQQFTEADIWLNDGSYGGQEPPAALYYLTIP
jgi:hypothetical protein